MELKDTIELMTSDSYKDRFVAEYEQLDTRINKLSVIIKRYENGTLDFTPATPINLLKMQVKFMEEYRTILEARAVIEGIDLNK